MEEENSHFFLWKFCSNAIQPTSHPITLAIHVLTLIDFLSHFPITVPLYFYDDFQRFNTSPASNGASSQHQTKNNNHSHSTPPQTNVQVPFPLGHHRGSSLCRNGPILSFRRRNAPSLPCIPRVHEATPTRTLIFTFWRRITSIPQRQCSYRFLPRYVFNLLWLICGIGPGVGAVWGQNGHKRRPAPQHPQPHQPTPNSERHFATIKFSFLWDIILSACRRTIRLWH